MGNRSNINLVGNTTQGQNVGDGAEVFKTKALGNLLQFRTISSTGDSIQIYQVDDKILISGASGGGLVGSTESCYTLLGVGAGDSVSNPTSYITAIGYNAGCSFASQYGTFIGHLAGVSNNAIFNVFIGSYAGNNNTGIENTIVGHNAGRSSGVGSSNVIIGNSAGFSETGSHRLHIANSSSCSLIYGEFDNKLVCIDNKLSTGYLQVTSGATDGYVLTSDVSGNATWQAGGGGGISTATNGVSVDGNNFVLGGTLTGDTEINTSSNKLSITNLSTRTSELDILFIKADGELVTGATTSVSAGASGDTQLSDGSGGFVCSPAGDMKQISGGSWIQGTNNSIIGPNSSFSGVWGNSNTIDDGIYTYVFGESNCVCRAAFGTYYTFIAGNQNYENCTYGNNVLLGNGNTAWNEAYLSVAIGYNNNLCFDATGGVNQGIALGEANCIFGAGPVGIGYANVANSNAYAMGYTNNAQGELSVTLGYSNTTCVGAIAAVAIGDGTIVCSGACGAFTHGTSAIAEIPSERAVSAGGVNDAALGAISSNGFTREINFFGYTCTATTPYAQLMTKKCPSDGGVDYCGYFDLTQRLHALGFNIIVTGTDLTSNDSAAFFFEGAIKMSGSGGTVSWVGTPTKTSYCDSGFNVDAQIYANNTDKRLDICVTGETATCIGWAATLYGNQIRKYS